jgi:hypothetical protein
LSNMVCEPVRLRAKGQARWGIVRARLVFLAQISLVIWYGRGQIPIHPIVVMLPLVGLLHGKIERRGLEWLGLRLRLNV